jgi:hypothetical protein
MKRINTITTAVLALMCALAFAQPAKAQDNGTEFGVADDLTVLGSTGTWADPDVEIKGFTLFGPAGGPQVIASTNGNVAINGNLQVNATSYFGSSVTIAGQAIIGSSLNVTGYGVFQSTVQIGAGNLKYGNGAKDKVMKSGGDGFVYWGDDDAGGFVSGDQNRIPMYDGAGLTASQFLQNPLNLGISMISGSSLTINGPFQSTGTVRLGNATAGQGEVAIAGALSVDGDVDLNARLNVDGASTFVASMTALGDTQFGNSISDSHSINRSTETGVAFSVAGSGTQGEYVAKFYSDNSLAAWIKKK